MKKIIYLLLLIIAKNGFTQNIRPLECSGAGARMDTLVERVNDAVSYLNNTKATTAQLADSLDSIRAEMPDIGALVPKADSNTAGGYASYTLVVDSLAALRGDIGTGGSENGDSSWVSARFGSGTDTILMSGNGIIFTDYPNNINILSGLKTGDLTAINYFDNIQIGKLNSHITGAFLGNIYIGNDIGSDTIQLNRNNIAIGKNIFRKSGHHVREAIAIGSEASYSDSISTQNVVLGNQAHYYNKQGSYNTIAGYGAGYSSLGHGNVFIGNQAGRSSDNDSEVAIGNSAGGTGTCRYNIYLGNGAGYNANDISYRLFINSFTRASFADDTTKSIIYGFQDGNTINQRLYFNSNVYVRHNLNLLGLPQTGSYNLVLKNGIVDTSAVSGGSETDPYYGASLWAGLDTTTHIATKNDLSLLDTNKVYDELTVGDTSEMGHRVVLDESGINYILYGDNDDFSVSRHPVYGNSAALRLGDMTLYTKPGGLFVPTIFNKSKGGPYIFEIGNTHFGIWDNMFRFGTTFVVDTSGNTTISGKLKQDSIPEGVYNAVWKDGVLDSALLNSGEGGNPILANVTADDTTRWATDTYNPVLINVTANDTTRWGQSGGEADLTGNVTIGTNQSNYVKFNGQVFFDTTGVNSNDTVSLYAIRQGDSLLLQYAPFVDVQATFDTAYMYAYFGNLINQLSQRIDSLEGADHTAPQPVSAELGNYSDSIVIVLFNESLHSDSVPAITAIDITQGGESVGIEAIDINYDTLFVALDSTLTAGTTLLLSYSKDYYELQDSSNNTVASFNNLSVTNNLIAEGGYSTEYQTIYNAFGTKPSAQVAAYQDTLVRDLVDAGIWDLLDVFYLFAANDTTNAVINWISPGTYNATNNGASFTTLEGFAGNGSSAYINSNWSPASNGDNYTLNNASFGFYSRTAGAGTGVAMGCENTGTTYCEPNYSSGNLSCRMNSGTYATWAHGADGSGFFGISRASDAAILQYRNNEGNAPSLASNALPADNMHILCTSSNGSRSGYATLQLSMAFMGAAMNETRMAAFSAAIEKYMDSNEKGVQ